MSELTIKKEISSENTQIDKKNITVSPDCDIEEARDAFFVQVDMPGLDRQDIQVELDRDMLTVEGVATVDGLDARRYRRQFRVMRGLDAADVQADYKNGVLSLRLPKPLERQARQIKVQAG